MMTIETIACALGPIASHPPMRSRRRRGPSAIATVRSGVALAPGGGAESTRAIETPLRIACLTAAASARPDAPAPATTTSKMGVGSPMGLGSFPSIVGWMRQRSKARAGLEGSR
jgi:hypothetical protein